VVDESRVCPIVFGIRKTDITGPLAKFQATDFNEVEVRQLLKTINKAAEKPLTKQRLDAAFKMWWPELEEKVQAISSAAQPTTAVTHRKAEVLLEEVVENTRAIIRELQVLPPWQPFARMSPEVEAHYLALVRGQKQGPRGLAGGLEGSTVSVRDTVNEPPPGPPGGGAAKPDE
jgi:hypothetical protein